MVGITAPYDPLVPVASRGRGGAMMFALLVDGREIGRWPTRPQAETCALERGLVYRDTRRQWLRPGVAIVQIERSDGC